jgi:hypothetical protein
VPRARWRPIAITDQPLCFERDTLPLRSHSIKKLSDSCGKEWEAHYQCLEQHNQEFYRCRKPEKSLNQCVFDKLVRSLIISASALDPGLTMYADPLRSSSLLPEIGQEHPGIARRTGAGPREEEPRLWMSAFPPLI